MLNSGRTFQTKDVPFSIKAVDLERNEFEGMASVFGVEDAHGDVIHPGAFKKTLAENAKRVKAGRPSRIKILYQHQIDKPIGKPTVLEETPDGLAVRGRISETSLGRDTLILLRDEVITDLSIGFNSIKDSPRDNGVGRDLKELRLWEFSPVTWGANDLANISGVKGIPFFNLMNLIQVGKRDISSSVDLDEALSDVKTLLEGMKPETLHTETEPPETSDAETVLGQLQELAREMRLGS